MNPILEVTGVTTGYTEKPVISDISFRVMPKEIRVILGPSGCGKTTLLKSMIGLLKSQKGSVRILGNVVEDMDADATVMMLRQVGVLFQNGALLGSLTVGQNVALPLEMFTALPSSIIAEIVHLKLAQVDLCNVDHLFPQALSGGMRKRVALARALVLDPVLVFCDEPSAGLDPVTAAGLDDLLLKLRQELGLTIVVITHELFSIETIADTIIFLDKGAMIFDGPLSQVASIESGPVYDFFHRKDSNRRGPAVQSKRTFHTE